MGVFGFENEQDVPGMQKTKQQTNSSNRLTIVPKKLWKSRAKSQTRVSSNTTCAWMPEGNCCWKTENGYKVTLNSTNLLTLSEVERLALQQMALSKLRAMNLNCKIEIPKVDSSVLKMKRRTVLLRNKAKTTTLDGREKKDIPSENSVFGVPLQQCIQNERLLKHRGSMQPLTVDDTNSSNFLDDTRLGATSNRNSLFVDNTEAEKEYGKNYQYDIESSEPQIPGVVNSCVRHLEEYGLHTLGLFRVTSSRRRVRQLREDLENGSIVNLNENHHPHDVAQLLKEYFRDLPEPLLTRDLYSGFVAAQRHKDKNKQLDIFRYLIYLLPVQNRDTLWTLLHFLSNVAQNALDTRNVNGVWQTGNKMDSSNLATLFGPNILHTSQKKGKEYEFAVDRAYKPEECCDVINVVQNLIDNYKKLFTVTADDLDSTYRRLLLEDPEALQNLLNKLYIHNLESKRRSQKSYSDRSEAYVKEVKIERSRQRDKKIVVLPIITISSDNKSSKTKTVLVDNDDADSNNTLVPPGFKNDSPSLRRKSFPDQVIDRTSLLGVNTSSKTPTFSLFINQDNFLSDSNESIAMANSKTDSLDYCKISNITKMEECLTLSSNNTVQTEEFQRGRKYLKTPEDKFHIEKSASASSISGNKMQEKREKSHKMSKFSSKVGSKQTGTNSSSKMLSLDANSKYECKSRPNVSHNHTSTVHYQQERWKRWEIIASEHTEV